jgi:hypothetical protein
MKFSNRSADNGTVEQGTSATGVAGPMVQGVVNDGPPAFVDGYVQPLSLNSEGRLRTSIEPPHLDFFSLAGQVPDINAGSTKNPWDF